MKKGVKILLAILVLAGVGLISFGLTYNYLSNEGEIKLLKGEVGSYSGTIVKHWQYEGESGTSEFFITVVIKSDGTYKRSMNGDVWEGEYEKEGNMIILNDYETLTKSKGKWIFSSSRHPFSGELEKE